MSLPKIEIPTYRVNLSGINKTIKYRAYTVKEEKVLLMAVQSREQKEIMETILRSCQECIFDDIIVKDLPITDLEKLMVSIRSKSVGETTKTALSCPHCEEKTDIEINLENMKEIGDITIESVVQLNEDYGLQLKPPTMSSISDNITSEQELLTNSIVSAIQNVFDKENVYVFSDYTDEEKNKFVDDLSIEDAKKITEGYLSKLPKNVIDINYKCPHCNKKVKRELDNLVDFFT